MQASAPPLTGERARFTSSRPRRGRQRDALAGSPAAYIFSMIAVANSEHFTSFASFISRAKS